MGRGKNKINLGVEVFYLKPKKLLWILAIDKFVEADRERTNLCFDT